MVIWWSISFIAVIAYFVMLVLYVIKWEQIDEPEKINSTPTTTVCVIVVGRNEASNILPCLDAIALQDYPNHLYEIIFVDDHSEDQTYALAKSLQINNLQVYRLNELTSIPKNLKAYKKLAIQKAIDQTNATLILTTDADCIMQKTWISSMVNAFETSNAKMIAGPISIYRDHNLIERFQNLDTCGMMLTTGAVLEASKGYMCNGANLAYTKLAFDEVNGFEGVDHVASGDDLMLMAKIAEKYPSQINFNKDQKAIVYTPAQKTLQEFINQRLRWTSKNKDLKDRWLQFQLAIAWLANTLLLINLLFAFFAWIFSGGSIWFNSVFILLTIKMLADFIYLFSATSFFKRKSLLWLFLPAEFMHIAYVSLIGLFGSFGEYTWKGRKLN